METGMLRESGFNNKPIAMVSVNNEHYLKMKLSPCFTIVFDNFVYSLVSNTIGKMNSGLSVNSLVRHASRVMNG